MTTGGRVFLQFLVISILMENRLFVNIIGEIYNHSYSAEKVFLVSQGCPLNVH